MLSFKNFPSKHIQPIPLNKINIRSDSKSFQIEEIQRDARLDRIDNYYFDLVNIINSKTKNGFKHKYKGDEIKDMYCDIFNVTKIPPNHSKKNDAIDAIAYYLTNVYKPRKTIDTSNVVIASKASFYTIDDDD